MSEAVSVIGGGLAGSEAAFQLAVRGIRTRLIEMRPSVNAPAHHTPALGELVCSNSLKSTDPHSAPGMLKAELASLGSIVLACARATAVPAGGALAVDRERFSALLTHTLEGLDALEIVREEATTIPSGDVIVASGPLTSPSLAEALSAYVGSDRMAFFDAAAPIVDAETIDRSRCFAASRYGKGGGADYLNCPLDEEQYTSFLEALVGAERVHAKDFETADLFQACQPAEEIARRGPDALRFGAMKPVGLIDPHTDMRPWAVVQLRPENREGTAYNLVGFQTNLRFGEQERVFRTIPGLERAEFLRYGVMHRNTFIDAPRLLDADLSLRSCHRLRVAGQLSGTEGYLEAAASGLVAALGIVWERAGGASKLPALPRETALGALIAYATDPETSPYQPMHVNFGLLPPTDPPIRHKKPRYEAFSARGAVALEAWKGACPELAIAETSAIASRAGERA